MFFFGVCIVVGVLLNILSLFYYGIVVVVYLLNVNVIGIVC